MVTPSPAHADPERLRPIVREVLREVLGDVLPELVAAPTPASLSPGASSAGEGTRYVRLQDDADLDAFVRDLVRLLDSPARRADLRSGRLRFRLAGPRETVADAPAGPGTAAAAPRERRIESGAVTERHVVEAAADGVRLVLGRRAVLTPLARDRARAARVDVIREAAPARRRDR